MSRTPYKPTEVATPHAFNDLAGMTPKCQAAIGQLADLRITQGTTVPTFDPYAIVTRGQMAAFMSRTMHLLLNS